MSLDRAQPLPERFPVGGQRQPVYDFLTAHGYTMSAESDKHWRRSDGSELHLYGSGSRARIYRKDQTLIADAPLAIAVIAAEQS